MKINNQLRWPTSVRFLHSWAGLRRSTGKFAPEIFWSSWKEEDRPGELRGQWVYSQGLYFPPRAGGEVCIFRFYNNEQTNKQERGGRSSMKKSLKVSRKPYSLDQSCLKQHIALRSRWAQKGAGKSKSYSHWGTQETAWGPLPPAWENFKRQRSRQF